MDKDRAEKGRCLGFGELEGQCSNRPGDSPFSRYWCKSCDKQRMAQIDAFFEESNRRLGLNTGNVV